MEAIPQLGRPLAGCGTLTTKIRHHMGQGCQMEWLLQTGIQLLGFFSVASVRFFLVFLPTVAPLKEKFLPILFWREQNWSPCSSDKDKHLASCLPSPTAPSLPRDLLHSFSAQLYQIPVMWAPKQAAEAGHSGRVFPFIGRGTVTLCLFSAVCMLFTLYTSIELASLCSLYWGRWATRGSWNQFRRWLCRHLKSDVESKWAE